MSKGWNLINRFSEDIDISIGRNFFENVLNLTFAKCENNNQVKKLRKASRDYIHGKLSAELSAELFKLGIKGYTIQNETIAGVPPRPIDHDSDPTVIFVNYQSILPSSMRLIDTRVKIEISCLSMSEPHEYCEIHSLIFDKFPEEDDEMTASIKTVTPSRTFLEKALLLSEEFQKKEPRSLRMSRHLYDLDRLMDTEFAQKALNDGKLYKAIVEHRRRFYHWDMLTMTKTIQLRLILSPKMK